MTNNTASRTLVGAATLAPSSHNTQPWRFRVTAAAVDLFADRTRALPVNDPDDRELTISCGAAVLNLRVAAAHCDLRCDVQIVSSAEEPDWLAHVALGAGPAVDTAEAALYESLTERRTYRKKFADAPVPADVIDRLREAAGAEGARLTPILADADRQAVAALVSEGDAVQWANPSWRRELAAWMHPRRRGDGLVMPGLVVPVAQLVVRTFDMGGGVGAKDRALAEGSPLLALVETTRDTPSDWLSAGQALQRVLLTACSFGLQASYLNQPIQVPPLRPRLRDLVRAEGMPQILLRLGYPDQAIPPAPRRPLDDVVDKAEPAIARVVARRTP